MKTIHFTLLLSFWFLFVHGFSENLYSAVFSENQARLSQVHELKIVDIHEKVIFINQHLEIPQNVSTIPNPFKTQQVLKSVAPIPGDAVQLRYDQSTVVNALGLLNGGTFTAAVRFPSTTMSSYAGMKLDGVEIYIHHQPQSLILKIWGAGTYNSPGNLLFSAPLLPTPGNWLTYSIPANIILDGTDLWIGYTVTHAQGSYPAGVGPGPANPWLGDLFSFDDVTFASLYDSFGFSFNWNIAAFLVTQSNTSVTVFAGDDATICSGEKYEISDASASNYASLFWTTSGDGYFITPVSLNPVYVPGPGDVVNGTVTLCLSATPSSGGNSVNDCMTLTIDLSPGNCCCPEFQLKSDYHICPPEMGCRADGQGNIKDIMVACRNSTHTYTVYPNDALYNYQWIISGGSPASFSGNPVQIHWGNGSTGFIKVIISGNGCLDSIVRQICLIDGPKADFILSSDTICKGSSVQFFNTSTGGSVFTWDFGNGNTYSGANPPPQVYNTAGTYTITLTVQDQGHLSGSPDQPPCGCRDTITKTLVVLDAEGPEIITDCCFGTVCPGGTSTFSTNQICPTYQWTVTGGTIISGAGTNTITVQWPATYPGVPTSVSLSLPGCSAAPCNGSTTLNVPVLYPNLPIQGPSSVCIGSSGTYSLPVLPGTYYNWSVSGGGYLFNQQNQNVATVNITFLFPGTYTIQCQYHNPMIGCSGQSSLTVNVLPSFQIMGGDDKVCQGSPEMYFANGIAFWSVSPSTGVVYSPGPSSNTTIIFNNPGTYVITATPQNPSLYCNTSTTKMVEVIAKPILTVITGPTVVCPGKNLTYSVSSNVSGSPFIWQITSGSGNILSEMGADKDSVVVSFSGSGPWQLSVFQQIEIAPGVYCPSNPQSINITPYAPPTVSGPLTVCADAIVSYTASGPVPPGGITWSIVPAGQGSILSGQGTSTISVQWHAPQNNLVTLKAEHCGGSHTLNITVNAPPSVNVNYSTLPVFCLGDNTILTLTATTCAGCTYQWYNNQSNLVGTGPSLNIPVNSFTQPGTYSYYVVVTQNGCSMKSKIIDVIIKDCLPPGGGPGPCDVLAQFWSYVECDKVTLIDKSIVIPPSFIASYQWTVTGPGSGTFSPSATVPSPVLTVTASGTYQITLTITSSTGCTSTYSEYVNILLPTADFTFTAPACVDEPVVFTPIPNNPNFNYFWDFGDGYQSYVASTNHAYSAASPPPYNVTLILTDEKGCVATVQKQIWINPKSPCLITASDTIFCPGGFVTLTACPGMANYQWFKDDQPITGAVNSALIVYQHGEYAVEVTNTFGCKTKAQSVYIYMHPTPVADIKGDQSVCASAFSNAYFYLETPFHPNYTYQWNGPSGNPSQYFNPSNLHYVFGQMPPGTTGQYIFTVTVTDTTTGCQATDYICVTFYQTPILTIPFYSGCEGTGVTLTPSPIDTVNYSYQWSSGQTSPIITVSAAGSYFLTIIDKKTGCSSGALAAIIHKKPDLSLFPIGCKTILCNDSIDLYIPLPLNHIAWPNTITDTYPVIEWYDQNSNLVGTGDIFTFIPPTTGSYQFTVQVQNYLGCTNSAGTFCLEVEPCCEIVVTTGHTNASCPTSCNGSIQVLLSPSSMGGPFTITQVSPPGGTWPLTPGIPFVLNNLCPGPYQFIISDPTGFCTKPLNFEIGYSSQVCCNIIVDYVHTTMATCPTSCDGTMTIQLNAASTQSPFTLTQIVPPGPSYVLTAGVPFTITNLCPGFYKFSIMDASGLCVNENVLARIIPMHDVCCEIIIQQQEAVNASCPQLCDGSFTIQLHPSSVGGPFVITQVMPSGGSWPLTPGIPLTINNLCAGNYTFVISDPSGACQQQISVNIGVDSEICCMINLQSFTYVNASCPNSCDGSISFVIDPSSYYSPFTVTLVSPPGPTWTVPAGVPVSVSNLCAGVYVFLINDASGICQEELSFLIENQNETCCEILVGEISSTNASCPQSCDGSLTFTINPASTVSPFTITQVSPPGPTWTIPAGTPFVLNNLCTGGYLFTITDASGQCFEEVPVYIGFDHEICCEIIIDQLMVTNATCSQTCDGSIQIMLNPASIGGPFIISQIMPSGGSWPIIPGVPFSLTNLCPGNYQFVISDPTGACAYPVNLSVLFDQEICCFAAIDPSFIKITSPITITSNTVWDNKYFIADHVIVTVTNGAMLDVTTMDIVFGECAGIVFQNGAYIRANNTVFRPCEMNKTWKGLRFDDPVNNSSVINIINECTFKNAEIALYFLRGADALISNNLFSNCNTGIRVENNPNFNHVISGNRFVTDTFYPALKTQCDYPFTHVFDVYGIYSTHTHFTQPVSQNEFINIYSSQSNLVVQGIFQTSGSGRYSQNKFTENDYGIFLINQLGFTAVDNSQFEFTNKGKIGIYVDGCNGPIIKIYGNTIMNNYSVKTAMAGIHTFHSSRLSITGNLVHGFTYGILSQHSRYTEISDNVINKALIIGIYFSESHPSASYITCNEITMRNYFNSTGFYGENMSRFSQVTSNCINDCSVSMDFRSFTPLAPVLPRIRNNFLYNYSQIGINVQGQAGNIGTTADPGLNTLWSNQNFAIDINKSAAPPITVAHNFGVFNISVPNVIITGAAPMHSTASCAKQIFGSPSQGNLNTAFVCDNFWKLQGPLTGNDGNYEPTTNYLQQLINSEQPFTELSTLITSLPEWPETELHHSLNALNLSENEKSLLLTMFYARKGLNASALQALQSFLPENTAQYNLKHLMELDLRTITEGWDILTEEVAAMLESFVNPDEVNANLAVYLINNTPGFRDYQVLMPVIDQAQLSVQTLHLSGNDHHLAIYPNPAKNSVTIEMFNTLNNTAQIEILDVTGNLVMNLTPTFSGGVIELDIRHLKPGLYMITLSDKQAGILQTGKFIKISE